MLRRFNLGEAGRIVSFLTREGGKVRAVARSARRPKSKFAGVLEPLTHIHLEYSGKETADLFHVTSADVLRSFDRLRRDYDKAMSALVMAELLDRLVEGGGPQPEIFDLSLGVLDLMEEKDSAEDPLLLFEARFLRELGYQPNLDGCARCGADLTAGGAFFRAGAADLLCPKCSSGGVRLSPGTVKHLAALSALPFDRASRLSAVRVVREEAQRFLHAFLTAVSGAHLKSLRFLSGAAPQRSRRT
ncbi:MAG: DNA repair protein RecO [Nitrospinota bacterium]